MDNAFYRVANDQSGQPGDAYFWVAESDKPVSEDPTLQDAFLRASVDQGWGMQNAMAQAEQMRGGIPQMTHEQHYPMGLGMVPSFSEMKKIRDESAQLNEIPCSTEAISVIMALTVDVLRAYGMMVKMGELEAKMSVSKLAPPSAISQQVSQLENGLVVLYSKLPRAAVDALMTLPPSEIPGLPIDAVPTNSLPYSFVTPRPRKVRPIPASPYDMPPMAAMMPGRSYFGQGMFGEHPFDKTPRNDGYSQPAMPPPRAPHPRRTNANPDRELTPPEHGWNAKYNSGVTGVVWDRVHQAWVVSWTLGGKRTFRHFTCKSYGGFDLARESAIEFRLARNKEIDAYNRRTRGRG